MEVKKNLTNAQRKFLDEIYTKQFRNKEKDILAAREKEDNILQAKVLKDFTKDKNIKKYLEAGKTFYELRKKLDPTFKKNGIGVTEYVSSIPELKISYGYANEYQLAPELAEFRAETRRIESALEDRKLEMRGKIHGVNATYEEVEADIKALLATI